MFMAVISLGLPFPALILGPLPAITHSYEILPFLTEGKGCFHSWNAHWPQRCYTLATGRVFRVSWHAQVKAGWLWSQQLFTIKASLAREQCSLCGEGERTWTVNSNWPGSWSMYHDSLSLLICEMGLIIIPTSQPSRECHEWKELCSGPGKWYLLHKDYIFSPSYWLLSLSGPSPRKEENGTSKGLIGEGVMKGLSIDLWRCG